MGDPGHLAKLAIVVMPAEIDSTNADRVGEELAAALTPGVWAVVADMTATTFCDPPAVAMLVSVHLRATANNAELRLVTRSGAVLRALAIAMVDYSLPVYPTIAAALIPRPTPLALPPAASTGPPVLGSCGVAHRTAPAAVQVMAVRADDQPMRP